MAYIGRSGWNSLSLDGAIPDEDLLDAVDESYRLVVEKLPAQAPARRAGRADVRIFGFTRYGGPEVAALRDVPAPEPGPGEVLVAMRAAGVNPADVKVRDGARRDQVEVRFPMAMGREAAGVVVAHRSRCAGFSVGDEVFGSVSSGTGALAELVLLDAAGTARPSSVAVVGAGGQHPGVGRHRASTASTSWTSRRAAPSSSSARAAASAAAPSSSRAHAGLRVVGVASAAKSDLVERLGGLHVASGCRLDRPGGGGRARRGRRRPRPGRWRGLPRGAVPPGRRAPGW